MGWENDQRSLEVFSDDERFSATFTIYDDGHDLVVFADGHSKLISICYTAFSEIEDLGGLKPFDGGGFYCMVVNNPPQERLNLAFENVLAVLASNSLRFLEKPA